jgi:hypothetical protein
MCPFGYVPDESGKAAAVQDDGELQFPPQWMVRHDAEIAADVGDDRADRSAADLGDNLLRRRQAGQAGVRLGWFLGCLVAERALCVLRGRAWRLRLRIRSGGTAQQPGLERSGTLQGKRDARQDQRDVAGAEAANDEGGIIRQAALPDRGDELLAVVDELADQAEQAHEAAAPVRARGPGSGLGG